MFFLLAILFVLSAVFYQRMYALPKALPKQKIELIPESKPLFQFTKNINWEKMAADAAAARVARRQELERLDDKQSIAQMDAEDLHNAARKAHHIPPQIITYSNSVAQKGFLIMFRKEPGEKHWESYERKHANAKIGAWIWLHTAIPYDNENIHASYAIRRVDTPERWERHTYYYHQNEPIKTSNKYYSVGYKDHAEAMAAKLRVGRKYFSSGTITEQTILYRTKTVDEWSDFMRLHADATVGSLIPFYEATLKSDQEHRVMCAIHRIDAPERWEEHIYMFRTNERVPHF